MGKLLSKMKIFHLVLLILSGLLLISALPFKTQYSDIYVNVNTTIEKAGPDDINTSLKRDQKYLYDFFEDNYCDDFVDNNGVEFDHNFKTYQAQVYEFENNLNSLNTLILWFGIGALIGVAVLYIFSNNSRRIYYGSNVIVSAVFTLAMVILFIVTLIKSISVMSDFSKNSVLYNYVALFQGDDASDYYLKACPIGDGGVIGKGSLVDLKAAFSCDTTTFLAYDAIIAVYTVYVLFVFILSVAKYKATAERRNELAKVVTVND